MPDPNETRDPSPDPDMQPGLNPELDVVQRWMQAVITHPFGVSEGIGSEKARREIDVASDQVEQVIRPSQALSAIERLEVYGNAYYARLMECLREEFSLLVKVIGQDVFDQFALGYLQHYPSRSYTLGHLADHFTQYLRETRPEDEGDWADSMIDLAELEWHINQVFDGPGVEGRPLLSPEDVGQVPPDRWPEARLVPVCCLRVLRFDFPVNTYFTAARSSDEPPPLPKAAEEYVALTRRDFVVRRYPLLPPQYELLSALIAGRTVGEAIAAAAEVAAADLEQLARSLQQWFQHWASEGFFERIELSD